MIGRKNLFGTNRVTQIGIIVKNIEETSKKYAEVFGVKTPGYMITDPIEKTHAEYLGKPLEGRAKLAFFRFRNITIELIEPIDGPSTWQNFLDTHGEGVHHIAFNIRKKKTVIERLKALKMNVEQKGDYTGGSYTYIDSRSDLKVLRELLAFGP